MHHAQTEWLCYISLLLTVIMRKKERTSEVYQSQLGKLEYQNKAEISGLIFSVRDCSFNDKMRLYIRDLPQILIQTEVSL